MFRTIDAPAVTRRSVPLSYFLADRDGFSNLKHKRVPQHPQCWPTRATRRLRSPLAAAPDATIAAERVPPAPEGGLGETGPTLRLWCVLWYRGSLGVLRGRLPGPANDGSALPLCPKLSAGRRAAAVNGTDCF